MSVFSDARIAAQIPLADIAAAFGVSCEVVEQWEKGLRDAPPYVLRSLTFIGSFSRAEREAQGRFVADPAPQSQPLSLDRGNSELHSESAPDTQRPALTADLFGLDPSYEKARLAERAFVRPERNSAFQRGLHRPRLLDLFCCAGGAAVGYYRAGFDVVGIDIVPRPSYPYKFIQADALELDPSFLASFDVIHASPPCQSYSDLAKRNGNGDSWPRLIEPVREMLMRSGRPYIIENVEGAPLIDPIVLCGTMFPGLRVLRHRLFETNFPVVVPQHKKHPKVHTFDRRKSHFGRTNEWTDFVQVTGGGNCTLAAARDAMGIEWMSKAEINEAIPPAYTELIGRQLVPLLHWEDDSTQRCSELPHAQYEVTPMGTGHLAIGCATAHPNKPERSVAPRSLTCLMQC